MLRPWLLQPTFCWFSSANQDKHMPNQSMLVLFSFFSLCNQLYWMEVQSFEIIWHKISQIGYICQTVWQKKNGKSKSGWGLMILEFRDIGDNTFWKFQRQDGYGYFLEKQTLPLILNQFFHKSLPYLSEISNHFLHKRLHRCHIYSFEFFQVDCTIKVNMFANFSQDC